MSLTNQQLGTLSKYRSQAVWSVVLPIAPGSSQLTTVADSVTYAAATQAAFDARAVRRWIRPGDRIIELRCNGQFHSFGG